MPEQIGNNNKTIAWTDKIVSNANKRALIANKADNLQLSRSRYSETAVSGKNSITSSDRSRVIPITHSPGENSVGEEIRLSAAENISPGPAADSAGLREPDTQAEQNKGKNKKINPEVIADKVYRLMQKDLKLEIERIGR